jgi:hypothetical protein
MMEIDILADRLCKQDFSIVDSPNRVLVLRRRSPSTRLDHESQRDGFLQLARGQVENPNLEFLTPGGLIGTDYSFKLTIDPDSPDFQASSVFVAKHQGQYTAVILHTCPFLFTLNLLPTIATLLQKGGKMMWTTRPEGANTVGFLPKETFQRIIKQFDQHHSDKWHVYFNDFQVLSPGLFIKP